MRINKKSAVSCRWIIHEAEITFVRRVSKIRVCIKKALKLRVATWAKRGFIISSGRVKNPVCPNLVGSRSKLSSLKMVRGVGPLE